MVTKYTAEDLQLKTKEKIEKIIGKPVTFAYPFGLWNSCFHQVEKSGYKMAYILSTKEIQLRLFILFDV
jgi:uncharacterized membrane protein YiaA